jgi:tetratricopeptide (TPR) repeat protein
VLHVTGRSREAAEAYRRARDLLADLPGPLHERAAYENHLGATLSHLAELRGGRQNLAETRALLETAVHHHRLALAGRPRQPAYRLYLASQLTRLGVTSARLGEFVKAESACREAATLLEALKTDYPSTPRFGEEAAEVNGVLGHVLAAAGRRPEARESYARAAAELERLTKEFPDAADYHRDLAWLLTTCPEPQCRDAARALGLAERAVKLAPQGGDCWRALGAARCRAGDWPGAVAALEEAVARRSGGDGREWLLLAMTHWHLGDRPKARVWYDRAKAWLAETETPNLTLLRLGDEVAALMDAGKN